jgi:glycerol-3-phosphate dehydrogenase
MDDHQLGLWVTQQAVSAGVKIKLGMAAQQISTRADVVFVGGQTAQHQRLLNMAGPWAADLAQKSGISLKNQLDLVRGSHLVLSDKCPQAMLLEVPGERRIFFVLPWKDKTLIGTTEVRQSLDDPIECSSEEQRYLLQAYKHYFPNAACEVESVFAGLRPLIKSASNPTQATREYAIEKHGQLLNVLGGKWTTSMALAQKIKEKVDH